MLVVWQFIRCTLSYCAFACVSVLARSVCSVCTYQYALNCASFCAQAHSFSFSCSSRSDRYIFNIHLQINVKLNTCHTVSHGHHISESMRKVSTMGIKTYWQCGVGTYEHRENKNKKRIELKWKMNLHATSMVADWLFAFPRGDHAWQSHLNGVLPKYSNTKSFDMVAVTSCSCTPVCGSTCESNVDGGGCELPLHLNVSWIGKKERKIKRLNNYYSKKKQWKCTF